jgi:PTS system nitrogen regulatory IIA component
MYLNVVQIAESFGVEESVIRGWVRDEGMPHVPERGRLLFDRAQVASWAVERGLAAKVGFLAPEATRAGRDRRIETMLRTGGIWRDVAPGAILDALETVVGRLPGATPAVRQLLTQRVRASDGVIWAPVGSGLALPHLRSPVALGRDSGVLALLFLREPLAAGDPAPDGAPVLRLLFFVAPSPRAHLELLARLSTALHHGALRRQVLESAPDEAIFAALAADEGEPAAAGEGASE